MSLTVQFNTILSMIGMGIWLGIALETYGRFLKRPKRAHWVLFINDTLFWVLQGLIIFYILLFVNQGEIRFYIFLALLCGYAMYKSLFQNIYVRLLERIITITIRVYLMIRQLVIILFIRPIKQLIQILLAILLFLLTAVQWILTLIYKIIGYPLLWFAKILWRITPNRIKIFFTKFGKLAGIFRRVKNIVFKWWDRTRN